MVDCMLSYAATTLVKLLLTTEGAARLELLKENPKQARQFLLLAYLYSHCDSSSLSSLRKELVPPRFAAPTVGPDIDSEWAGAAVPISSQGRYFCGTINRGECIHRWWPLQLVCRWGLVLLLLCTRVASRTLRRTGAGGYSCSMLQLLRISVIIDRCMMVVGDIAGWVQPLQSTPAQPVQHLDAWRAQQLWSTHGTLAHASRAERDILRKLCE